jgi:hypothetical protein
MNLEVDFEDYATAQGQNQKSRTTGIVSIKSLQMLATSPESWLNTCNSTIVNCLPDRLPKKYHGHRSVILPNEIRRQQGKPLVQAFRNAHSI